MKWKRATSADGSASRLKGLILGLFALVAMIAIGWFVTIRDDRALIANLAPQDRESDLLIYGYLQSEKITPDRRVCWLGALGSEAPRRVTSVAPFPIGRFKMSRSTIYVNEQSSLETLNDCAAAHLVLLRFPLPDTTGLQDEFRSALIELTGEFMATTGRAQAFAKVSSMFAYSTGETYHIFLRRTP